MSTWESQIAKFQAKLDRRVNDVFLNTAEKIRDSAVFGSDITGAPGQPVDTGNLKNSWQLTHPEKLLARITTNVEYAEAVEEGIQAPYTTKGGTTVTPHAMVFKSAKGGPHSVRLTRSGFDRIVNAAVKEEVT